MLVPWKDIFSVVKANCGCIKVAEAFNFLLKLIKGVPAPPPGQSDYYNLRNADTLLPLNTVKNS